MGLSEVNVALLERALAIHPVAAVQMEWSLLSREIEAQLAPFCAQQGVAIVAYSPLSRNLLAAPTKPAAGDWRATSAPRFSDAHFADNAKLADVVKAHAAAAGATAAQLSLAWLFHRAKELGVTVMPIPGTTSVAHALDNLAALRFAPLADAVAADLAKLAANVKGERYAASMMKSTFENL